MSADGNDRGGVKAPRTLFSLGRPGAKRSADAGESKEATGGVDTADAPEGQAFTDQTLADQDFTDEGFTDQALADEGDIQYACGACGALLAGGASFCGECGTPVALDDDELGDDGMLDELASLDAEPLAEPTEPTEPVVDPDESSEHPPIAAAVTAGAVVAGAELAGAEMPAAEPTPAATQMPAAEMPAAEPTPAATQMPAASDAPATSGTPVEPAGVLFADPSMAEPLPDSPAGSFTVSSPVHGSAADAHPTDDAAPAGAAAVGGAAIAGAALGGAAVGAGVADAAPAGAALGGAPADASAVAPSPTPAPSEVPAEPGFPGTTASSMPYGTGPVESSAGSGRGLLIAAVVVVGLLLFGAIAFALTRGGSNDVATQTSTIPAPVTTAKKDVGKGSTTSAAAESSTTTSEATATSTEATSSTTEAPTTAVSSTPSTSSTPNSSSTPTNPPTTAPPVGALSFQGPADFGVIPKGGSVSFTVSNVGTGAGNFQCSANNLQLSPSSGSLAPGQSQQVIVVDFRRVEAAYSITCVGAGNSRFDSKVTVGKN